MSRVQAPSVAPFLKGQFSISKFDFLIVGAGLTGLNLARELKEAQESLHVLIAEKSKSCGGRMATRRVGDSRYDHGAQFIKNSSGAQKLFEVWRQGNVLNKFPSDLFEAYCGPSGMTDLAKALAASLNISYNLKVLKLEKQSDRWRLSLEEGESLEAHQVVLTCPLPQSLEILNQSGISFPAGLATITYQKAVALLLHFDSALEPGMNYAENVDKNIFSICSQQAKGLAKSPDYTVVMQEAWTNTQFDRADDDIATAARTVLSQKFPRQNILNLQVKKWRYAQPARLWNQFFENPAPGLYLAGDAFGGASLNGALKSSNSLAEHLKTLLVEAQILELLKRRGAGKTICPSEVLPESQKQDKILMESVRAAARRLAAKGEIAILQKGIAVDPSTAKGPIRLKLI